MTIRQFLEKNVITDVETANGILINLVCDEVLYGLNIDTLSIPNGTILVRTKDFQITDTHISSGESQYNLDEIELL